MSNGAVGNANRLLGYLASFLSASLLYVIWFAIESWTLGGHVSVLFDLGFAVVFWFFEGTAAAFLLMALPWYLAVILHDRLQGSGLIYFVLIGAASTAVIGSATASLAPKPLFIEDQTFLQGFMIAVARQGICMFLSGVLFGGTFWLVSERGRHVGSKNADSD